MAELQQLSVSELLRLHSDVMNELRKRKILRTGNVPTGDYAEMLFARAFGWQLQNNSSAGYDAVDGSGIRYQIKCRRNTPANASRQLGALRNLANRPFDILAALLIDEYFNVTRAALIPIDVVVEKSRFTERVNAHRFVLRDSVWLLAGVSDVTEALRLAQRV